MNSINTATARLNYENAQVLVRNAGMDPEKTKLTQGFLRLEALLQVGKTQYIFPVMSNQVGSAGLIFPTELRLNQQDSFIANQMGIFLALPAGNADGAFTLSSYPNKAKFATTGVAAALETIYNGNINISINNDIVLPAWDVSRHRFVPETQNGVGVTAETVFPIDQLDGSTDGFYPVEPNILFIGSKNTVVALNLPAGLAAVDATARVVIILRGNVAQNSTSIV